ncbi:MAG: threonine--tRNA ligase [Nanoarchaeota archaeon]|nr:threonine--tRNA ligase [Nanoarchaeota archaeon]
MKTLNLHCDYIKFKALKKALKSVDEIAPGQKLEGSSKDCLVVMVAVEKGDSLESVDALVKDIKDISSQVKTNNIVLYPYAHLSSNLGSPPLAVEILNKTALGLNGFDVVSAPFGYYKEFELKVKGHPLSELSRSIVVGGDEVAEEGLSDVEIKHLLREISKAKLDTSKLKENDHRILGGRMNLWSFNNVAPGMVFWHDKGLFIKNQLIDFWRQEHRKENYQEISTPQIMDSKIWKVSGHWDKYKENNFITSYEKRPFIAKPMNCPGGMLVYNSSPKSYRDLPLRVGELGIVHRVELSGVLSGLFRVIQFTQDDAHIFCKDNKQVKEEIFNLVDLIKRFYKVFNLDFDHLELSTRPEKRIGSDKDWDTAEKILEDVLKEKKIKYKINKGDGAFYGPKIDFHAKDSLGRTWQLSTIQLDFALPERFELKFTDEKGNEKRPIMLHRVIYGSVERFLGVLTEHLDGKFPLWLSPNQVMVMNMNEDVLGFAKEVYQKLFDDGIRVEINDKNESIGKKARDAQIQRFNYLVTVGEKEMKEKKVAVRSRESNEIKLMKLEEFIEMIREEIFRKEI